MIIKIFTEGLRRVIITLLLMRGVPGSNHGSGTDYSDMFCGFTRPLQEDANVVKVKQICPATPCRHQGRAEYSFYSFLTSALDGGE
jgi:hypothetical protein